MNINRACHNGKPYLLQINNNNMTLAETIKNSFNQILITNGSNITNVTQQKDFIGLITSGDFITAFTEGDLDTELNFQISMMLTDAPRTGDRLLINGKKYIVQQIQNRTNGVISKATVHELTRQ